MKRNAMIKTITLGLLSSTMISGAAIAGGFDRGGVNIDQLFDKDRFSFSSRLTYVEPRRTLKNVTSTAPGAPGPATQGADVDVEGSYTVFRAGIKVNITDGVDCLAGYSEPFGGDANYGLGNIYSPSTVEFELNTQDYGLTCSYQFGAGDTEYGDGYGRIIFGASYLELDGFVTRQNGLFAGPTGLSRFTLEDQTYGWRAGFAYEIPAIALNATIVYNSAYNLDLTGVQDTSAVNAVAAFPIMLSTEMPQSVDVKLQTGINETTLAFLNMRWQDWSQLQLLNVLRQDTGAPTGAVLDLSYEDGYTITAGIGKRLSDEVSTLASLTWDRGTSTLVGTQTDSWTLSGGLRYKANPNFRVSVGAAIGLLEGGQSTLNPANALDPAGEQLLIILMLTTFTR